MTRKQRVNLVALIFTCALMVSPTATLELRIVCLFLALLSGLLFIFPPEREGTPNED